MTELKKLVNFGNIPAEGHNTTVNYVFFYKNRAKLLNVVDRTKLSCITMHRNIETFLSKIILSMTEHLDLIIF